MLSRIIDWSIGNKFFVILATVLVILGGVRALYVIPLDALPDLAGQILKGQTRGRVVVDVTA